MKKGIAPLYNAKTMENGVSQEPEAGAMDPASRFQVLRQEPWTWREPGAKGLAEGISIYMPILEAQLQFNSIREHS